MKKIFTMMFCLMAITMCFVSCSKDNNETSVPPQVEDVIDGAWELVSVNGVQLVTERTVFKFYADDKVMSISNPYINFNGYNTREFSFRYYSDNTLIIGKNILYTLSQLLSEDIKIRELRGDNKQSIEEITKLYTESFPTAIKSNTYDSWIKGYSSMKTTNYLQIDFVSDDDLVPYIFKRIVDIELVE